MRSLHLMVLPAFWWNSAFAQPLAPRVRLTERFLEDVPVGGSMLVGLQADDAGTMANPSNLNVLIPPHTRSVLCVTVNSIDGRYTGRGEYNVGESASGWHALLYTSAFSSQLTRYSTREVAVLAELKNRCIESESPEAIVVTAWTRGGAVGRAIALVNGSSADKIELTGAQCSELKLETAVAYDWICTMPLVKGKRTLKLRRFYFDKFRTLPVRVSVP